MESLQLELQALTETLSYSPNLGNVTAHLGDDYIQVAIKQLQKIHANVIKSQLESSKASVFISANSPNM